MNTLRKLLVIRLSALGDICMTLPVIDSACRAYPNVEFTLLTSKVGAIVANTVLKQPNFKVRSINKRDYNGITGLNRLYDELKVLEFDAVADLHDVLRTKWVDMRFKLAGKRVETIYKGRAEKKALVAHAISRQLQTSFDRYKEVFKKLGMSFEVDYEPQTLTTSQPHDLTTSQPHNLTTSQPHDLTTSQPHDLTTSQPHDLTTSHPSIGIAPFAQHQGKIYPVNKMREVIDLLMERHPSLTVYLFGSRDEQPVLDVWASAHPGRVVNLAGYQSIDTDLSKMTELQLLVSMDSANMHLASLVGLRCLSIWGATHRHAGFLGYHQQESDCIELPLSCRPCSVYGNKPCKLGDYPCLSGLRPEMVTERILKALSTPNI